MSDYIDSLSKQYQELPDEKRSEDISEADIGELVRCARADDRKAHEDLYAAYIPYFIAIARRYMRQYSLSTFTEEDLLSLSAVAFDRALSKYDESRSNSCFTGLLGVCFRRIINDEVLPNDSSRRLPKNRLQIARDCKKAVRRIRQKKHRDPHDAEEIYAMIQQMAQEAQDRASFRKITLQKVRWFLRSRAYDVSLADTLQDADGMRMRDTIEEENPGRIAAFLSNNPTENGEFIAWMRTARLTDRQQDVLSRFFGVSREKSEPLGRIADDYALSRERIRQIKERALEKMRDSSRSMVT